MNIRNGLALLTLVAGIGGTIYGFSWLYVRYIDKWIVRHPRLTIAIVYAVVATVVFIVGAMA